MGAPVEIRQTKSRYGSWSDKLFICFSFTLAVLAFEKSLKTLTMNTSTIYMIHEERKMKDNSKPVSNIIKRKWNSAINEKRTTTNMALRIPRS